MRFCQPHWDKLRAAIDAGGLSHLVAQGGVEAARRMVAEIEQGESSAETFDPLMAAHWAIVGRIGDVEPRVLTQPGCPICWVQDEHDAHCDTPGCTVTRQTFEDWIPGVAAHMRTEAERLKLIA